MTGCLRRFAPLRRKQWQINPHFEFDAGFTTIRVVKLKVTPIALKKHHPHPLNIRLKLGVLKFCKHRQVDAVGPQQIIQRLGNAATPLLRPIATPAVRRNMSDPMPVIVLARLAVDQRAQGRKLGAPLLQDAVKRCALVSQHAGIRALLVHVLHDRAKQFYEHYGFQASAVHPMTLWLRLQQS